LYIYLIKVKTDWLLKSENDTYLGWKGYYVKVKVF